MAGQLPKQYKQQQQSTSTGGHLTFPTTQTAHSILFVFKKYAYKPFGQGGFDAPGREIRRDGRTNNTFGRKGNRSSAVGLTGIDSIQLPFPKQLVDATGLKVNGFERSGLTAMAIEALSASADGLEGNIASIPGKLQNIGKGLADITSGSGDVEQIMKDALGTEIRDVGAAARYLLQNTLSGDAGATASAILERALNPKETLAFEGVNLKSHQFNWDLYPSNQQDSERIKQIIRRIKTKILPKVRDDGVFGVQKAFLEYPSMVDIYLIGVDETHYMKFKTCMVTDFTVDYGAGGGVAIMKGGKPAGVNLSMTLQELEAHTADDYDDSKITSEGINTIIDPNLFGNVS